MAACEASLGLRYPEQHCPAWAVRTQDASACVAERLRQQPPISRIAASSLSQPSKNSLHRIRSSLEDVDESALHFCERTRVRAHARLSERLEDQYVERVMSSFVTKEVSHITGLAEAVSDPLVSDPLVRKLALAFDEAASPPHASPDSPATASKARSSGGRTDARSELRRMGSAAERRSSGQTPPSGVDSGRAARSSRASPATSASHPVWGRSPFSRARSPSSGSPSARSPSSGSPSSRSASSSHPPPQRESPAPESPRLRSRSARGVPLDGGSSRSPRDGLQSAGSSPIQVPREQKSPLVHIYLSIYLCSTCCMSDEEEGLMEPRDLTSAADTIRAH